MFYRVILTLCLCITLACSQNVVTNEEDVLSDEERNSRCCAQKLNCCNKRSEPTNFEVRALLLKCNDDAKKHASNTSISLAYSKKRSVKTGEPRCSDDDETVKSCRKKIKLTIKIRNMGITNSKNQYILIDHVFDSVTSKKQKLQNPYVLKIKQFPILQTYGLSYESMVNLEAKEKVHNKYEQGYSGCNVDPSSPNPSCGSIKYKNEAIPFSTGFCCSCDDKQQTDNSNISGTSNITNRRSDKSSIDGTVGISNAGGGKVQADLNPSNDGSYSRYVRLTNENQLMDFEGKPGVYQKRGGQDCSDKSTPPTANPETYHQSAHCLEFSDVWYSVYHLDAPKVYHLLAIQIFEKNQESIDGGCKWRDLTKKTAIYIGTDVLHYTNEQNSIAMNYFASKKNKGTGYALNHKIHKLLIPDTTNIDPEKHQEVAGGPSEYLVIKEHQARTNGKSCNVAGVGYEAFAKQPNRCAMPQGSCLKNQPKQMWLHDHEAEENGKKGCYFLKFYGLLPLNPIQINTTTQNKTLRLYHTEHYTSIVDMEIKADENVILRPNTLVALTEAYVESTHLQKTSLIAKVFNTGLVSGVFMVSLTDCPLNLPASFSNINSKPVLIPPQRQHVFNLDIECALPVTDFFCSLQVLNVQHEILAVRKIRLRKQDRCFCMWYCYCSCLIADKYLKCNPLTLDEYRMAGFQGSLPMPLHVVQYTFMDDMMATMFLVLLILCLALLVLGLIKAIVGFFMVPVGEWGFDVILDLPKKIDTYYENDLNHRSVSYDSKGWPRHPDTGKRVRNIQFSAEFCINLVFFVIYPFALIWLSLRRFCCRPQETRPSYDSFGSCHCKNGTMVQRKSSTLQSALVKVRTESIE